MESQSVYVLEEGVQVRREKFGLLFYDYRGPRLYFVPSKDLLEDGFFDGTQSSDTRGGNHVPHTRLAPGVWFGNG